LLDTVSIATTPQVVNATTIIEGTYSKDVCLGQVDDVNVIANAGAVRSRIVIAKDVDVLPLTCSDLKRDGN